MLGLVSLWITSTNSADLGLRPTSRESTLSNHGPAGSSPVINVKNTIYIYILSNKLKAAWHVIYGLTDLRVRFNIRVYYESAHKNFRIHFFHRVQKKDINLFKTEMEGDERIHTHIFLSSRTLKIHIIN